MLTKGDVLAYLGKIDSARGTSGKAEEEVKKHEAKKGPVGEGKAAKQVSLAQLS